jgi:hypothetical protein
MRLGYLSDQSFATILKFLNQENVVIACQESIKAFFEALLHITRLECRGEIYQKNTARRIFSRYEKTIDNFSAFFHLCCVFIYLRGIETIKDYAL